MTRILVARLDKVGDTVLSTPFLHNLRRLYPQAVIIVLATPYNRDVLYHNPDVTEVVLEAKGPFDLAIALSPTTETYRAVAATRAAERWGLVYASRWPARLMTSVWLTSTTVIDVDGPLKRGEPVMHEVRQMLSILTSAGLAVEECPLQVHSNALQDAEAAAAFPGGLGIHFSVRWFTDGWGFAEFETLLGRLREAFPGETWLVTHGPAEREMAGRLQSQEGLVVAGERAFGTWAALIGRCRAYVSTDTGALHVAAARQVPVAAVYEAATYEHCSQQWAPWMVPHEKVRKAGVEETAARVIESLRGLAEGPGDGRQNLPASNLTH
ncbi:MAG TPA: glycosyltransferase family 9 protein [Candidatus Xenobia bacterium]|jgi:ADP-heptose:LPS heptosyltransferase